MRRWIIGLILAWGISFIILAGTGVFVIIRGQQTNNKLCEIARDNRILIINIITVSKRQALEAASDIVERNIVRQRYNELRALIPKPLDCKLKGGPQPSEP